MTSENISTIVTVTGGSGYIATHIVQQLLEKGYTVRATVRKVGSASSQHLTEEKLCPDGCPGKLVLYEADLIKENSFDDAVAGAKFVLHTASPFLINDGKKNPQRDLIDPAVKGTQNVLESCNKAGTVKRVVLTSSVAAIHTNANDKGDDYTFTEQDWNETANLKDSAYQLSKTLAERKAWEMAKEAKWDLVTINPSFVLGPTISGRANDGSFAFMKRLLDGSLYFGLPIYLGVVDVRDCAKSHILAFENEEAQGRHICCSEVLEMKKMGEIIRSRFTQFRTPTYYLPACVALVAGPCFGVPRSFVSNNAGIELKFDNAKIRNELHLEFTDTTQTFADTIQSMIDWGML